MSRHGTPALVKTIQVTEPERILVFGDLHGCFDEFQEILIKLSPKRGDIIISLGDVVDRGPASEKILAYMSTDYSDGVVKYMIMGNHEDKHIRYWNAIQAGKTSLMKISDEWLIEHEKIRPYMPYLFSLPDILKINIYDTFRYQFVHGGFPPDGNLSHQAVIRCNLIDKTTSKPISWPPEEKYKDVAAFWAEFYVPPTPEVYTFFGHAAFDDIYRFPAKKIYGLDTGCVFGNMLTCMEILPNTAMIIHQLRAKKVYFERQKS
jgi:predicted phosphodiesterase